LRVKCVDFKGLFPKKRVFFLQKITKKLIKTLQKITKKITKKIDIYRLYRVIHRLSTGYKVMLAVIFSLFVTLAVTLTWGLGVFICSG